MLGFWDWTTSLLVSPRKDDGFSEDNSIYFPFAKAIADFNILHFLGNVGSQRVIMCARLCIDCASTDDSPQTTEGFGRL